jgi:hypothetical protein
MPPTPPRTGLDNRTRRRRRKLAGHAVALVELHLADDSVAEAAGYAAEAAAALQQARGLHRSTKVRKAAAAALEARRHDWMRLAWRRVVAARAELADTRQDLEGAHAHRNRVARFVPRHPDSSFVLSIHDVHSDDTQEGETSPRPPTLHHRQRRQRKLKLRAAALARLHAADEAEAEVAAYAAEAASAMEEERAQYRSAKALCAAAAGETARRHQRVLLARQRKVHAREESADASNVLQEAKAAYTRMKRAMPTDPNAFTSSFSMFDFYSDEDEEDDQGDPNPNPNLNPNQGEDQWGEEDDQGDPNPNPNLNPNQGGDQGGDQEDDQAGPSRHSFPRLGRNPVYDPCPPDEIDL